MQVTIFTTSEFMGDVQAIPAKLQDVEVKPYAQFSKAVFVTYTPKRKRKARRFVKYGYDAPYVLILKGDHNLDLDAMQKVVLEDTDEVKMTQSKYSCFDKRYKTDFDAVIDAYIEKTETEIVFDSRTDEKLEVEAKKLQEV